MTRFNLSDAKREAHAILDLAKAGYKVPPDQIQWALIVLGDMA